MANFGPAMTARRHSRARRMRRARLLLFPLLMLSALCTFLIWLGAFLAYVFGGAL